MDESPVRKNRDDFRLISKQRKQEASALLRAGLFPGAYYLAGYSVECALKACIAKQTSRHDFPDKQIALDAWTHDLRKLVHSARAWRDLERDMENNPVLRTNWTIVSEWSEAVRYEVKITKDKAADLYAACTERRAGILPWIRQRW